MQLLYASDYKGVSRQKLLQNLRTRAFSSSSSNATSSSTSRSKARQGSSSSSSNGAASSEHVTVAPHHQELLHVLLGGVRHVAISRSAGVAELLVDHMDIIPLGVFWAIKARTKDADAAGSSSSSGGSRDRADDSVARARRQAVLAGERLPWHLVLPVHLSNLELLGLMPPYFSKTPAFLRDWLEDVESTRNQINKLMYLWHQQDRPDNLPQPQTVGRHAQMCLQSLMQLGLVMLSLCRRRSGETDADDCKPHQGYYSRGRSDKGDDIRECEEAVLPRELFAPYATLLRGAINWQGEIAGMGECNCTCCTHMQNGTFAWQCMCQHAVA